MREENGERGKKASVCSTFEASLSGLAAWSCVSKPRRAFHPLCCPRCVQCSEALCGEGRQHITFCPLSQAGGMGEMGGGRGCTTEGWRGTKRKLIEGSGSSKLGCTKAYKALLHAELCQM